MPYFVYRIAQGPSTVVKQLEKISQHEQFKPAKLEVRELRSKIEPGIPHEYKIMFAENELEAEEKLQEKREEQILQEWEK